MVEGFKNTEIGVIPEDWDTYNITNVIDNINGIKIGPFGSQLKNELLTKSGYKVYGQENVYVKNMEIGERYIPKEHFQKLNSCEIRPKDFLISMMGTIGKCLIVPDKFESGIMDSHLIRLRLNQGQINSELLLHFFNSNLLINQVKKLSVGGIMDGLSSKIVKQIQIPLPPTLAEQTAIATALNDADALITQLEKLIAKKKAIKQGAMQELLKPKEGWDWTTVEKLGKPYGGLSGKSKNDFNSGNCPYIPFMNVMSNPIIDKSFLRYVKIGSSENQNKAMKGDIFFNGSSETPEELGMCSVLLEDIPNLYLNSFCFGFRLNKELGTDGLYLAYYFRSSFGRRIFTILAQGATRHNLSKANFNKIEFQLPKSVEQKRISEIIQDMDNEIFEYEKKLEKQKQLKQGMMQSLLTGKIRLV